MKHKRVRTPSTDDSDVSHESTIEGSDVESRESKLTLTDETKNYWIGIPFRDVLKLRLDLNKPKEKLLNIVSQSVL